MNYKMAEINGTQRDIGRLEGRIEGLEKSVGNLDRHVSKLESKLSTKIDLLRDEIGLLKLASTNNKWKIAVLSLAMGGSATLGGVVSKLIPFFGK